MIHHDFLIHVSDQWTCVISYGSIIYLLIGHICFPSLKDWKGLHLWPRARLARLSRNSSANLLAYARGEYKAVCTGSRHGIIKSTKKGTPQLSCQNCFRILNRKSRERKSIYQCNSMYFQICIAFIVSNNLLYMTPSSAFKILATDGKCLQNIPNTAWLTLILTPVLKGRIFVIMPREFP